MTGDATSSQGAVSIHETLRARVRYRCVCGFKDLGGALEGAICSGCLWLSDSERGCVARPTDTKEIPQNTARIDRKTVKMLVCRGFVRAVLLTSIAPKSAGTARKRKYRPRRKSRFCRSFPSCTPVAVDAVDILQGFLGLQPWLSVYRNLSRAGV